MAPRLADDDSENEDNMDFVTVQSGSSLGVQWRSEYPSYDVREQVIYVNGNIKAPACPEEQRKPVDVVVVLDRSGSMRGQKLDLCLKTVQFLTRELSSNDRLSVISYDTDVRTDVPLTKMDQRGKALVELALPKIRAGSMTNLSGGLVQGLQEIQDDRRGDGDAPNAVKSVLLLTDGLANVGVTSTLKLVEMVGKMLHKDVSLFTFGYGTGHNEELLRSLSDAGRGVYYFVENVDGVSMAFADCLGGLLSVVAQNIKLELTAAPGCEITAIKTKKEVNVIESNKKYEVAVGDMYGEEERDFLLVMRIRGMQFGEKASYAPLNSRTTYVNVLESTFASQESSLTTERLKDLPSERVPDSHVLRQKNRVSAAEAMEEAMRVASAGDFAGAKTTLNATLERIGSTLNALSTDDKAHAEVLMEELGEAHANVLTRDVYCAGGGGKRLAAQTQMHYAQRNNEISAPTAMFASAKSTSAVKGRSRANAYRGPKKMKMMKKAFDNGNSH